jgi:hypothetical protein
MMPVPKYCLFCVVSFANVKNIGLLDVYHYSQNLQFSKNVEGGPVGYIMKKRKKFHPPLSWQCGFYRKSVGSMISTTSLSYPAHSIEGALNKHPHQFRNYRFFQLLILTHTIYKKIHRLPSFRDKSAC